jgi:hypothetical protein
MRDLLRVISAVALTCATISFFLWLALHDDNPEATKQYQAQARADEENARLRRYVEHEELLARLRVLHREEK